MTEVTLPADWDRDSRLPEDLARVLAKADCSWLQGMTEMAFVVAVGLRAEEDVDLRVALAERIAAQLLEVARTGLMPGEVLQ